MIHNLYQECKGFGKKNSIGREQETAFLLEEFMNRRYEFRYNTVLDDLNTASVIPSTFTLSPWTNVCATVSLSVP